MVVLEKKRIALRGFVGEASAAGLFPGQVFIEEIDGMTRQSELLAAHSAGRTATDNDIVRHLLSAHDRLVVQLRRGEEGS